MMRRLFIIFSLLLLTAPCLIARTSPVNGLFSAAIEDPSGLCANVSHYGGFTIVEFAPPDQWGASFQSYDAEMVITTDTIIVTEEEDNYSATYRIRYKFPFTAEGNIIFNGKSYVIRDNDTRNSACGSTGFTFFSGDIRPTGTPPAEPQPQPLTLTARASATSGFAPLTVSFTAAPSKPASIIWKDNGVTFASGPAAQLTFANASTHTITAIATADGETATATLIVTVQQKPPGGGGNGGNGGNNGGKL